ncbi:MAG: PqqD family protein [Oscillospiraceae bacterium]|nr:PqqD family protein [Oscillospiraceae bacterium]
MKTKENFVLRSVAGQSVVVAVAQASVDFNGMLTLNESGAILWRVLEKGREKKDLVDALLAEYEVDEATAAQSVEKFLETLQTAGCVETE